MLLAIDAGNTNIVFALMQGCKVLHSWRISSDDRRTTDEYAVWLLQLMALAGVPREEISACVLCSVRPGSTHVLRTLCRCHMGHEPSVVGEGALASVVPLDVDPGTRVGADRLVNAYAARALGLTPSIVLDFGTATTFDVVAHDGRYCGGIIAPGLNLSVKALAEAAAHLPNIAIAQPKCVLGRNTVDAMQSGVFWGYMSLIEGLANRLRAELGDDITGGQALRFVSTGGLAALFVEAGLGVAHHEPDLTMMGLAQIYTDLL